MAYMNVSESESALIGLANAYPSICELITLPNLTVEGRTSHAVRLGTAATNTVDAFYLTGNVHGEEWGSTDILVNLAADLCEAYSGGSGVGYGSKYFSAAEVKALMEQINIIIFPCVNPDGRNYSQDPLGDQLWRKNRNPADSGGDPWKIGVDINRNQNFLWDFNTAFAPAAINGYVASEYPASDTYHGIAPCSEAETRNIDYILDTYTRIRWYVDVHSYSEDILYTWGDDEDQVTDPTKNFQNPAYDHRRGLIGGDYADYIPDGDLSSVLALSQAFTRSLGEVRGKYYVAKPSFSLYPTSGTNQDYAYSRHFTNPALSNALSFTVEWGTEFQPPWDEMVEIIRDVCAGLMGMELKALGIDSFIVTNRDTFSSYEVDTTKDYDDAFYVIYDGFTPSALGVPGAVPSIRFVDAGGDISSMSAVNTGFDLENPGALTTPQRISFTFRVHFNDTSAFPADEVRDIYVEARLGGITDVALMHLIREPNPYMADGPVSWLSTDVRVFQLRPGEKIHSSSAITLQDPDVIPDAPYNYIQGLVAELRGYGNADAPSFENLPVYQNELELSRTVGGVRVLNFAVAKVRYRSNIQDAVDVRAFFRAFNTMVSDLSYTRDTSAQMQNYRRTSSGTIPLLGINHFFSSVGNQITSVPYFAERRVDTAAQSMVVQLDNTNKQTLVQAGATETHTYFGCWLDFNQTDPQFPVNVPGASDGPFTDRVSILQLVRGIHQCLVAEIRFQPGTVDPIANGSTPASSDRLAQRNLAIVESDNPGIESTHQVQHTFLLKPSPAARAVQFEALTTGTERQTRYDELVFRWHDLPRETIASLFLPDWNADEVIALNATLRPGPQILNKVDAHTVSFSVCDITYLPIPGQNRDAMPGLLTLQLPLTVLVGQRFTVDVQQHTGLTSRIKQRPSEDTTKMREKQMPKMIDFSRRRVLGAFRVDVVVKSGEPLLQKLVRNLAVLRYIFQAIPATDSWHPVFGRYLLQLGDQISGLGVDPSLIPASPDDPGIPGKLPVQKEQRLTGKVREVIFDCFGDFKGFVLETCSDQHYIRSQEKRVAEIMLRVCRERCIVTVRVSEHEIREIIIHC
ncbi:MAG: M14 family metallopeptidase [Methanoregula sp.]|nr:M14 family metallopeptidase [Methanoregula sp.]